MFGHLWPTLFEPGPLKRVLSGLWGTFHRNGKPIHEYAQSAKLKKGCVWGALLDFSLYNPCWISSVLLVVEMQPPHIGRDGGDIRCWCSWNALSPPGWDHCLFLSLIFMDVSGKCREESQAFYQAVLEQEHSTLFLYSPLHNNQQQFVEWSNTCQWMPRGCASDSLKMKKLCFKFIWIWKLTFFLNNCHFSNEIVKK